MLATHTWICSYGTYRFKAYKTISINIHKILQTIQLQSSSIVYNFSK